MGLYQYLPNAELVVELLIGLSWPTVAIVALFSLKERWLDLIRLAKGKDIKIVAKGIEFILADLSEKMSLSQLQLEELRGLTSAEIWALESFSKEFKDRKIEELPVAAKVAAKTLLNLEIVKLEGQYVVLTDIGHQILISAENILGKKNDPPR